MSYYYYKEFNRIELHYWLEFDSHSMDAIVQNRCEQKFLELLTELAVIFKVDIQIETEPLAEGGLRRYYKIIAKEEGKKAIITTAVVASLITSIIVTPITTAISKLTEIAIDKAFEDKEVKAKKEEKEQLELVKLKQELKIDSMIINQNITIEKTRANFYKQLQNSKSVEKFSVALFDEKRNKLKDEVFVEKSEFRDFQISRNMVEKLSLSTSNVIEEVFEEFENASIEITSPDFSLNSDKWKGIYNGKPILFKIKSIEFDNLVQTGSIQFKKGTTINCLLSEKRRNNKGKEYEISRVNYYLVNNQKVETQEGKKYKLNDENDNN